MLFPDPLLLTLYQSPGQFSHFAFAFVSSIPLHLRSYLLVYLVSVLEISAASAGLVILCGQLADACATLYLSARSGTVSYRSLPFRFVPFPFPFPSVSFRSVPFSACLPVCLSVCLPACFLWVYPLCVSVNVRCIRAEK